MQGGNYAETALFTVTLWQVNGLPFQTSYLRPAHASAESEFVDVTKAGAFGYFQELVDGRDVPNLDLMLTLLWWSCAVGGVPHNPLGFDAPGKRFVDYPM